MTIMPGRTASRTMLNVRHVSSSVHQYLNYSKKMQTRLAEINDNVSNMIKESCTGIDNICNKVRQCLNELDISQSTKNMYLTDEVTEYEIVDERSRSEEISQDIDETAADISVMENLEYEKLDSKETTADTPAITPFFTVVNFNEQGDTNNSKSCYKQVLNKTIYSILSNESFAQLHTDSGMSYENLNNTISTICDNFELMNKLVENISEEITKFSETAIPKEEKKSEMVIEKNEPSISAPSGLKPIKRLSKHNSRQKSVQVGDSLSQQEVIIQLHSKDSVSFMTPDVYRKRAFTDLYQKLIAQVEANDSLIFFQTLMERQKIFEEKSNKNCTSQIKLNIPVMNYSVPKTISSSGNQTQSNKKLDIGKKYAGSLWFSQKTGTNSKNSSRNSSKNASRKASRKECRSKKVNRTVESKSLKSENDLDLKRNRKKIKTECNKSLIEMEKITKKSCSIECTCKMVVQNNASQSPSTKCHLKWLKAKTPTRKLKFLDILDDLTNKDLLPLQSEYPRKDNQRPRELDYKEIQDTYLYKLMYGPQGTKNVWKQLLEPTTQCSKNCSLCRNNSRSSTPKKIKDEKNSKTYMDKFCMQNYSRGEVIRKLSRYMFDPDKSASNFSQSVIVMPVRVYYDNPKSNEPPTKLKPANKPPMWIPPSKEIKQIKKGEWPAPGTSRPLKVVYDKAPKKPEGTVKSSGVSPKLLINSARLATDKSPVKKIKSRSFSPRSFAPYCQEVKKVKKLLPTEKKREENVELYNKIQADIQKIKKEIYGKKISNTDKKLWAHKYSKSVGQQLISFIQNQKPEAVSPPPIYATPRFPSPINAPGKHSNFLRKISPHRQMLLHVKDLPVQDDAVQKNIKKAIDVIETRMMDILHNDANSVEAFDIMEREITTVLSLMKCTGEKTPKSAQSNRLNFKDTSAPSKGPHVEEQFDIISDQLFERLQRILDTGSSVPSTPEQNAERKPQPNKEKDETKKKQKVSTLKRNKTNVLSPSTSASMDEKVVARRYPKSFAKKADKPDFKPKSSTLPSIILEPVYPEKWENVCGDQSPNRNLSKKKECQSEILEVIEDFALRDSGDYIKAGETIHSNNVLSYNIQVDDVCADKPECNNEVEKVKTEETSEMWATVEESLKNIKNNDVTQEAVINSETESVINDKITRIIDSILSLDEETAVTRRESEVLKYDYLNKETFQSSDYNTPPCELQELDMKLDNILAEATEDIDTKVDNLVCDLQEIDTELDESAKPENVSIEPLEIKENIPSPKFEKTYTELQNNPASEPSEICTKTDDNVLPSKSIEKYVKMQSNPRFELQEINIKFPKLPTLDTPSEIDELQSKESGSSCFTEEVHKIIKKVEDIYSHLDVIQNSDSLESIPVFKEANVPNIKSEIFLSPFMQAVKERRKNPNDPKRLEIIEKSPSYYNVMSFLENLSNIQKEVAYEINIARLCFYGQAYQQPIAYNRAEIWHDIEYSTSFVEKPSCLKKNTSIEETKHTKMKKVSFLELGKEDKSAQAAFCPFHKVKVIRISSQQFPPLEPLNEVEVFEEIDPSNDTTKVDFQQECAMENQTYESKSEASMTDNDDQQKVPCEAPSNKRTYAISNYVKDFIPVCKKHQEYLKSGESCGETTNRETSSLDDKVTQVFCQMHQENLKTCHNTENGYISSDEHSTTDHSIDCREYCEENLDDSKSTDKDLYDDSLIDPFYDYNSQNNIKVVQKIEEKHEGENNSKNPAKIVVFRQVLEGSDLLPFKDVNSLKDIEMYKKRLEKRKEIRLRRKSSTELLKYKLPKVKIDNENVVLLKSFYAIVYILMFTALSLDYRCL